jgi:hypothetical protein
MLACPTVAGADRKDLMCETGGPGRRGRLERRSGRGDGVHRVGIHGSQGVIAAARRFAIEVASQSTDKGGSDGL